MLRKTERTKFDHARVCNRVGCKNPPLIDGDFCSGQCAAQTVEEYQEVAGDLFHFPGPNISPEYQEKNSRVNTPTK